MKRVKKSKDQRVTEALRALNTAMSMEDPHIRITSPGVISFGSPCEEDSRAFGKAIKTFVEAYKKYYMVEKVKLELAL